MTFGRHGTPRSSVSPHWRIGGTRGRAVSKGSVRYCCSRSGARSCNRDLLVRLVDHLKSKVDAFAFAFAFASHTVISPAAIPGDEPTVINIGHVDELHYVSTIPYNEEMVETNLSCGNQYAQVIGSETVANTLSQEDRIRAQKREWIRKKRANKEFRDKENKAKQNKRSANIEKIR